MKSLCLLIVSLVIGLIGAIKCDIKTINPPGCGYRLRDLDRDYENKVIGGKDAVVGDWGWMVTINYNGKLHCGASLINSQWIMTAAHCTHGRTNPAPYSIDIGHHDRLQLESWAVSRKALLIVNHELYSESGFKNDIALIKLDKSVVYSNYILPACLSDGSVSYDNRESWATGWGMNAFLVGSTMRYLQEVAMPVLTDARCKAKYASVDKELALCAGDTGLNADTCQSDSGGPLAVEHKQGEQGSGEAKKGRWYVVGITSWGYGCGDGGVYARVSKYVSDGWILRTLQAN